MQWLISFELILSHRWSVLSYLSKPIRINPVFTCLDSMCTLTQKKQRLILTVIVNLNEAVFNWVEIWIYNTASLHREVLFCFNTDIWWGHRTSEWQHLPPHTNHAFGADRAQPQALTIAEHIKEKRQRCRTLWRTVAFISSPYLRPFIDTKSFSCCLLSTRLSNPSSFSPYI